MDLKAAIFDMDGTLLDSMGLWKNITSKVLEHFMLEVSDEENDKLDKMYIREKMKYLSQQGAVRMPEHEMLRRVRMIISEQYLTQSSVKQGVEEYLQELHNLGIPAGVATVTDGAIARGALEHHGLLKYFRFVIGSDEIGKSKTEPDIYFEAARRLDARPDETVVFEDALYAVRTAKAAGFTVYGIRDEYSKSDTEDIRLLSDRFIKDFRELL